MTIGQATATFVGVTIRRWYVYETDGRRRVVWATDAEAALRKAWRSASAALSDHVDPAPPAGYDAGYRRVPRPAGDPLAHRR